ncbi:uncharacterized protein LOC133140679 isoform X2 [Conger conger]|uniref:uncharacterized protein LOC133140679 isoform X2 n=1 Tax=Conger conger TaxID=82655 RepID=UPI002A5A4F95|nr:uncharacterized protein LOC133140679 isoform X2 [Conger conger]
MLSKMASGYCRSLLTSSIFRSFATRYINSRKIWECNRVATTLAMVRDVSGCTQFSHHWTAAHIRLLRVFSLRNVLSAQKLFTEAGAPFNEGDYPPLPEYKTDPGHESKDIFMVCVKGLPWSCTPEDLLEFFSECQIHDGVNGIHLTVNREGRPNGGAVIELEQEEDIFKALQKHREYIGSRYVHVYEVSSIEAEAILMQSIQPFAQRRRMVKLQGLPYSCTEKDVAEFFSGLEIVPDGVALVTDQKGRYTGLAYVEFTSQEMADRAVARHGSTMGTRYIKVLPVPIKSEVQSQRGLKEEVSPSLPAATETDTHPESNPVPRSVEYSRNLGHSVHTGGLPFEVTGQDILNAAFNKDDYPPLPDVKTDPGHESKDIFRVRVKGLPWSCTPEDLLEFFSECQIHDGVNGIHLTVNRDGRPNGEAVIELEQEEDVFKALEKHREYIGSRYVHVYEVSSSEAEDILRQSDQLLAQRHRMVKLQGLPYSCTEKDVAEFFSGLEIVPHGVALVTNHKRRNTGLAYVEFTSQEMAERAVAKDGNTMGTRYIKVLPVPIKSEVQSQRGLKEEVSPSLPAATETDTHPESNDPVPRSVQYSRNPEHSVHTRGLPFEVTGQDILNAGAAFNKDDYPTLPDVKTDPGHESKDIFMVCVKGLPWLCTPEDLLEFFSECQIHDGVNGIHLTVSRDGRPNGEAVIELEQEEDVFKALEKHREYIGSRYVHVYEVSSSEAEDILRQSDQFLAQRRRMVKLQGLPYSCTEKDVAEFFSGLEIVPDGVALVTDHKRRNIGLAYVEFTSQEMAERAVAKDGNTMGTRYIDVLPVPIKSEVQSLKEEVSPSLPAATETDTHPESKDPNLGHFIHMRGLPFDVTGQDIVNFFSPVRLEKILIEHDANGRANGQAVVRFCSHEDAMAAMSKDKAHLQGQDVGLILNSPTMIGYDETEKR